MMEELQKIEHIEVSGGAVGAEVIKGALEGNAPGPGTLTGTASGPTPGGRGGRYRESNKNVPRSRSNMPGGGIGRMVDKIIEKMGKKDN